jgi:hypothetical protein
MRRVVACVVLLLPLGTGHGRDCFAARHESRSADARQVGRYMKLWVIGGGEAITLRDPMGRMAQATDSTAWSRIPACSTGANPPLGIEEDGQLAVHGGFFIVKEPLVGTWRLEVRRDTAPRFPMDKGPNVGVYAERHSLSDSTDWADERDRAWLALGESMTWKIEVRPPSTPTDSSWLQLVRADTFGSTEVRVLTDTTLTFHWTPGVWFMLARVDCDREDGMDAIITDPSGKVLCPLESSAWGATVANKCDCIAAHFGPREGAHGVSCVSTSAWEPRRGLYRIRVRGLAQCRIVVRGGGQFSRQPHWAAADTMNIGPGEEHAWTAQWGGVTAGDSSRVTLRRSR